MKGGRSQTNLYLNLKSTTMFRMCVCGKNESWKLFLFNRFPNKKNSRRKTGFMRHSRNSTTLYIQKRYFIHFFEGRMQLSTSCFQKSKVDTTTQPKKYHLNFFIVLRVCVEPKTCSFFPFLFEHIFFVLLAICMAALVSLLPIKCHKNISCVYST